MIPNVIHMMYFIGPKSRPFNFINYLAVRAAFEIQKPDLFYFYYNEEPVGNEHWENIKEYVTLVKINPPDIDYPQYQADFVRMEKIIEHGGIYLDTDMILLKNLFPFMDEPCTLGGEGYVDAKIGLNSKNIKDIASISNAIMICEPQNKFMKMWYEKMPEAMKSDIWAYHAVVLPLDLYKQNPNLVDLQTVETFVPFDFRDDSIFYEVDGAEEELRKSYSMHLWETIWKDRIQSIDNDYLKNKNTVLAKMLRQYHK
jgi:hypothetical protein